jgi:DNA-binding NarL/FixJ family response regulator
MGVRVVVVEDDAFTRTMLVSTLSQAGLSVILETGSAAEAVQKAPNLKPSVAVLDLHLGIGPTGIDVAHALRRNDPAIGIIFLTSYSDPRLLDANLPPMPGNSQYLTKESVIQLEVLLQAISNSLVNKSAKTKFNTTSNMNTLTDVQIEVLRLLADGMSNSEIAKRRVVSEKSIEVTIARIAKTLNLAKDSSRNQRVHMAKAYFAALGMNHKLHDEN